MAVVTATAVEEHTEEPFLGIRPERIRAIVHGIYGMDETTEAEIDQLAKDFPDSPVPEFFRVARLYYRQYYARVDTALSAKFEADALASLEKAKAYAQKHEESAEADLIVGLNQFALAIFYVDHKRWWSAFWKARAGRRTVERVLERDPDIHDAKLPLGLGNCYLSKVPRYLKPMAALLGRGDMELGWQQLEDAANKGLFTTVDAVYYQSAVKVELQNDAEGARKIMEPLAERFPTNPEFQLFLSRLEYSNGQKEESAARVNALLKMPQAEPFPGLRTRAVLNLAWNAMREQRYADALELANSSERIIDSDPVLEAMRAESLLAQAEANKAVGNIELSFRKFEAIPREDAHNYQHAQNRIAQIKKEVGWTQ